MPHIKYSNLRSVNATIEHENENSILEWKAMRKNETRRRLLAEDKRERFAEEECLLFLVYICREDRSKNSYCKVSAEPIIANNSFV